MEEKVCPISQASAATAGFNYGPGSIVAVGKGTIKQINPEDFKKAQFKTEIKVQPKQVKPEPAAKRKPVVKKKASK